MALFRLSLREFRRRLSRTLLTICSIALGVAAIVAVLVSSDVARTAQKSLLNAIQGESHFEIRAEGGGLFDEKVVESVQAIAGIHQLAPYVSRVSVFTTPAGIQARIQLLGINPELDASLQAYQVVEGKGLEDPKDVLLDRSFARSLDLKLNEELEFLTASGKQVSRLVGLVEPQRVGAGNHGAVAIVNLKSAQRWFRGRGKITSVQVQLQANAVASEVQRQMESQLPPGFVVQSPGGSTQTAEETMLATQGGLRLATICAMIIAIFIIYNTFQMSVGERRRQIGILRALGTTRGQVIMMILIEALALGAIGIVIGWSLGFFGAVGLTQMSQGLLGVKLQVGPLGWFPLFVSAIAGASVTLCGALIPAIKASRLSPAEAMRVISRQDFEVVHKLPVWFGVVLFLVCSLLLLRCTQVPLPPYYSTIGIAGLLIGWMFILPGILDVATRMALLAMQAWMGVQGKLAQRQLLRHHYRSSLTIGVLFLAISTSLGMAITLLDNIQDVQRWYERTIVGDFFIRAAMPDMATGQSADMPSDLSEELKSIAGIEKLESLRFVTARSEDMSVVIIVREFNHDEQVYFDLVAGDETKVIAQVQEGNVVIGSVLAERAKLKVGDSIVLKTLQGTRSLPIVGISNEYMVGGLTVFMNRRLAKELYEVEGADVFIVKADRTRMQEVETQLKEVCLRRGLMFQTYKDLVRYIRGIMNGVVASLWVLLTLGIVIACFGLINTLAMSILEQTREIGLLRAVAMTRQQIRKLITCQALLMAVVAIIPGVPLGVVIAYLLNLTSQAGTGHAIAFHLRVGLILISVSLELVLIALAALIPAERASRIPMTEALQYE